MKSIIIITFFLLAATFTRAQIIISEIDNPTSSSTSSVLEFGTEKRGILLPWVTSAAGVTGSVDGTIIFDVTDKKVKYKKAGTWFDLTVNTNGAINTALQDPLTEQGAAGVKIGTNGDADTTPGVLVLTDTDKAMILPKVTSPHLNIINPSPGMMVYDSATRQLAVFNGTVWSYWKP